MPQPRQPIKLTLLKGNTHFSKKEIEERINSEVSPGADNVKAPDYLPKELRKEFNRIAKALVRVGIMTDLDCDNLARFLVSREQWTIVMKQLREIDPNDDIVYYDRVLKVYDKLFSQLRSLSETLGLTVTSRGKIQVPKVTDEKVDEVKRKFGI